MKTQFARKSLWALATFGVLAASVQFANAQLSVAQNPSNGSAESQPAQIRLSYGVADILKLSAAHVGDEAIIAYIANSGTSFNLPVNEIIYLKSQGVSDRVLTAMLNQSKHIADTSTQPVVASTPPVAAPAQTQAAPASQSVYANAPGTQFAPAVAQQTAYVQTATPASSVYVIPNTSTTYVYPSGYTSYGYAYPYYGGYGGYYGGGYGCYSGLSLGIGIGLGGGWCGNGWYGGGCYRGGWGSGCWGGYRGGWGVGVGFGAGCGWRGGGWCRR
jgi:hypothetical protein